MSLKRLRNGTRSFAEDVRRDSKLDPNISLESIDSNTDEDPSFISQSKNNKKENKKLQLQPQPQQQDKVVDDDDDVVIAGYKRSARPKKQKVESQDSGSPIKAQKMRTVSEIVKKFSQPATASNSAPTSPIKKLRFTRKVEHRRDDDESGFEITGNKIATLSSLKSESAPVLESVENSEESEPWVEKYSPTLSSQISIHEKKLEELRNKITNLVHDDLVYNRILVVSGPCGSGKSTAVRLLCEEVMERKLKNQYGSVLTNNMSIELDNSIGENEYITNQFKHIVEFKNLVTSTSKLTSSVTHFSEFLNQCKLLTSKNSKCIVIEDLPNLYHYETLKKFQESLLDWIELGRSVRLPPLIICITEVEVDDEHGRNIFSIDTNFKTETVLGYKIMELENRGWQRVKFNPVAKKFLKRGLDRIVNCVSGSSFSKLAKIPKSKINSKVDELSKNGDLRNAINLLEFWCKFFYSPSNATLSSQLLGKETGLNVFHSIGKVIHGTQHPEEELTNFKKRSNLRVNFLNDGDFNSSDPTISSSFITRSLNSITIANVANEILATSSNFHLNLLENYSSINPPISQDLFELVDILSLANALTFQTSLATAGSTMDTNNLMGLEISSYLGCLGVRLKCESLKKMAKTNSTIRSNSESGKMRYTRDLKVMKKQRQIIQEIKQFQRKRANRLLRNIGRDANLGIFSKVSDLDVMLIDGFFESNILNSKRVRKIAGGRGVNVGKVRRLGGDFQNLILADSEFKVVDDGDDDEGGTSESRKSMKELEDLYFGVANGGEDQELGDSGDDEEFDLDPIVNTDDEDHEISNNIRKKDTKQTVKEGLDQEVDWDDDFSDDSLVLKL